MKKKEVWIAGVIGIIIGIVLMYLLGLIPAIGNKIGTANKVVAKSKAGIVTEQTLYTEMKKTYPISYLLELIDKPILEKKYNLTQEQKDEIEENIESILERYSNYGYTEEDFYEENGFESKEDFVNYMQLDYRRNLYCIDYFKTLIPSDKIKNYYDNNEIYGTIKTKHILVEISTNVTDAQALATANEIIAKLDSGTSFDDVADEYSDKAISEVVKFNSFEAASYAKEYVNASKSLEAGSYTKEAVKTDYGYHIIYCISKEEKPTLEEAENDIVEYLAQDLESEDPYIRYKALIKLREDNKVKFEDEKYEEEYKKYCDQLS